jgi:tRNA (mo5U34)-methyltransferase
MTSRPQPEHQARLRDVGREIADLGPWFHNLHLPDGTQTAPDHPLGDFPSFKWADLAHHIPEDLTGWRALDIGCNAGFYSFELARRGATVRGVDVDPRYLAQARWAARELGFEGRVEFERKQVYDLAHTAESYDLVLFMGVFYHLRYPLLGLDIVAQKVKRLLVFQTLTTPGEEVCEDTGSPGAYVNNHLVGREVLLEPGWPQMAFIEYRFAGDRTNWWIPNHAGVQAMLRSAGLRITKRPEEEIYLCEPDSDSPSPASTWDADELLSATGRAWGNGTAHSS